MIAGNQEPRCQDAKIQRIKAKENQESKKEYKKIQNFKGSPIFRGPFEIYTLEFFCSSLYFFLYSSLDLGILVLFLSNHLLKSFSK